MKIQESAENYLETILVLKKKNGVVRSIDIANDLGVSKPSVSVAMKNLRNGEYIEMDKEGYITCWIRDVKSQRKSMNVTHFLQTG